MTLLYLVSFILSILLVVCGGLLFSKAQRMYMKRIGRQSGWGYPWDMLSYRGKEKKLLRMAGVAVLLGLIVYFTSQPLH